MFLGCPWQRLCWYVYSHYSVGEASFPIPVPATSWNLSFCANGYVNNATYLFRLSFYNFEWMSFHWFIDCLHFFFCKSNESLAHVSVGFYILFLRFMQAFVESGNLFFVRSLQTFFSVDYLSFGIFVLFPHRNQKFTEGKMYWNTSIFFLMASGFYVLVLHQLGCCWGSYQKPTPIWFKESRNLLSSLTENPKVGKSLG